ncbi:MAG: hypothetical protein GYA17_15190, partial [Chloroflexi bacterium]|nr:hypothetical protein [Chloroflexota bacterium]
GGLGIFLLSRSPWRKRLADSILYGLTGATPLLVWGIYDLTQTATLSSRSVESTTSMLDRLANFWPQLREVILFWLVPDSWISAPPYPALANRLLVILLLVVLAAWMAWALRQRGSGEAVLGEPLANLAALLGLFALAYALVIFAVYVTTYPPITIASRMLSPVHVAVLWLAVVLSALTVERLKAVPLVRLALPAVLVVLLAWYGWRTFRIVEQNYALGLGYTSLAWQSSDTMQAVRQLPADTPIVTNEETAILFLTGRAAYPMMEIFSDRPDTNFYRYGEGYTVDDPAQGLFREDGAALVLFDSLTSQLTPIYAEQAAERAASLTEGLYPAFQGEDGAIYYYQAP